MQSQQIQLIIDKREHKIIEEIQQHMAKNSITNIEIIFDVLILGDIEIKYNNETVLLIERKTFTDLIASIKDGRYREQSMRLHHCSVQNHNIMYLIEGNIQDIDQKSMQLIYSTMTSIHIFKKFSIMRTNSICDSVNFLLSFADKSLRGIKNGKTLDLQNATEQSEQNYCSVIKTVKKQNVTKENIGEIMLMQIPGISAVLAKVILAKFSSFPQFIESINANPEILDGMTYMQNDKSRKINKKCIESIKHFLTQYQCS